MSSKKNKKAQEVVIPAVEENVIPATIVEGNEEQVFPTAGRRSRSCNSSSRADSC